MLVEVHQGDRHDPHERTHLTATVRPWKLAARREPAGLLLGRRPPMNATAETSRAPQSGWPLAFVADRRISV